MKKSLILLTFLLLLSCKKENIKIEENNSLKSNESLQNENVDNSEKSFSDENSEITELLNKYIIDNVLYRYLVQETTDEFGDKTNKLMACKAECKFSSQTNTLTVLNEFHKDYKYKYFLKGDILTLIDENNDEINYKIVLEKYGIVFVADKTFKFKTSNTNPFVYNVVGFIVQNKEYYNSYSKLPAQIK